MTAIALFGAGGKMGYRLASNLKGSRFEVRHVEVAPAGKARLKTGLGIDCVAPDAALDGADVVILAVPDTHIGKVAAGIDKQLKAGTMVVALDAAAPFAGHLPARPDLTYFVTHPCHPPIFNDETDLAAKNDHFGGVSAKQHIVNALMQGPESAYATGRGDRQGHLGAGDALASRHGRANGAARAGTLGDRGGDAFSSSCARRWTKWWRAACPRRRPATSFSAT